MLNIITMNKKHIVIYLTIVVIVSTGFALLGVEAARRYYPAVTSAVKAKVFPKNIKKAGGTEKSVQKKPDYVMVATAYVDTGETKSRIHAGVGSVAVDRKVIPHGTLLYIENYGLAVATDTGRLIKGYRLDVWFPDEETANQWGRKTVKVWKVGYADIKKILSTGGEYVKY
ncbi:MAG: 3D domain-containing protein [Eubacteriales bacterium]